MRTIGVEEELLLVDEDSGEVMPVAAEVLAKREHLIGIGGLPELAAELQREMIEAVTRRHVSLPALADEIVLGRAEADRISALFGARAVALATAPLPTTPHVSDDERYRTMTERYGVLTRRTLVCGMHVHVGIESPEEGVQVLDRIRTWLPLLVALSANSPFQDGEDTGHASYRTLWWNQWPCSGPSERFGSLAKYRAVERAMLDTGAMLDAGMVYTDARLSRHHPTVEVRVADVCLDPGAAAMIAGIVRALVDTAAAEWRSGRLPHVTPACAIRLASWQAALSGIRGDLVHPLSGRPEPAPAVLGALLEHVRTALVENGDQQLVERGIADTLARGTGAERQRAVHQQTGDLAEVVREALRATHRSNRRVVSAPSTDQGAETAGRDASVVTR